MHRCQVALPLLQIEEVKAAALAGKVPPPKKAGRKSKAKVSKVLGSVLLDEVRWEA